jgi:leucyl-tRNA synthetase
MGPFEDSKSWDPHGIVGVRRFLNRVWDFVIRNSSAEGGSSQGGKVSDEKALKVLHKTIKKVTQDIENFRFNTAISALMIFINEVEDLALIKKDLIDLLKIISPFAPHMAQELVEQLKYKKLFDIDVWPVWDEELIREENFELIIQINGKTRGKVLAKTGVDELSAKNLALADSNIKKWLEGKEIKKVIFIQNRLMNLIV